MKKKRKINNQRRKPRIEPSPWFRTVALKKKIDSSKSNAKKIEKKQMRPEPGIEPRSCEPKSQILPLNHSGEFVVSRCFKHDFVFKCEILIYYPRRNDSNQIFLSQFFVVVAVFYLYKQQYFIYIYS